MNFRCNDNPLAICIEYKTWPRGYKTFFMLKSAAHEISTAHKTKIHVPTNKKVSCFKSLRYC